jgi:16S rRNA (guanine527-N7)-methyltransferase
VSEEQALLCEGAELMGIALTEGQTRQLLDYCALIQKWNKTYNLSAIRDPLESVKKHLIDSLSILPFINKGQLLDVGAGAGLPGIVIAIMRDDVSVTVLDSVRKKCHFMQVVKTELGLSNLSVVNARVESFAPESLFSQITSRAFAEVDKTLNLTKHLLAQGGSYLLMKGDRAGEERAVDAKIVSHNLNVPFVSDRRSLLEIHL